MDWWKNRVAFKIMKYLLKQPKPISITGIYKNFMSPYSVIAAACRKLEKEEYVKSWIPFEDRRVRYVQITDKGRIEMNKQLKEVIG